MLALSYERTLGKEEDTGQNRGAQTPPSKGRRRRAFSPGVGVGRLSVGYLRGWYLWGK